MNILFVCGRNKRRSNTAEIVFNNPPEIETRSAGVSTDAENIVSSEDVQWADKIICMEKLHKEKLQKNFAEQLKSKSLYVLNIPDKYEYMEDELVKVLKNKLKGIVS